MNSNTVERETFSYSFKKNNIDDLFQNLTENPVGMDKKDFRLTLSTIYQVFEDEFEGTFPQPVTVLRNTNFKILSNGRKMEAFVYPTNNFDFYLKSKGSLYRFSETKMNVSTDGVDEEVYGYKVPIEILWEYFSYFDEIVDSEAASESFMALNKVTQFVLKAIQKLYFLPKIELKNTLFGVKYEIFSATNALADAMEHLYKLDIDKFSDTKHVTDKLIENYVTYIMFKFLNLKISKFKDLKTGIYFTKNMDHKRYMRSQDIAVGISEWLDEIYIGKYDIVPELKITKLAEDEYELTIWVKSLAEENKNLTR